MVTVSRIATPSRRRPGRPQERGCEAATRPRSESPCRAGPAVATHPVARPAGDDRGRPGRARARHRERGRVAGVQLRGAELQPATRARRRHPARRRQPRREHTLSGTRGEQVRCRHGRCHVIAHGDQRAGCTSEPAGGHARPDGTPWRPRRPPTRPPSAPRRPPTRPPPGGSRCRPPTAGQVGDDDRPEVVRVGGGRRPGGLGEQCGAVLLAGDVRAGPGVPERRAGGFAEPLVDRHRVAQRARPAGPQGTGDPLHRCDARPAQPRLRHALRRWLEADPRVTRMPGATLTVCAW